MIDRATPLTRHFRPGGGIHKLFRSSRKRHILRRALEVTTIAAIAWTGLCVSWYNITDASPGEPENNSTPALIEHYSQDYKPHAVPRRVPQDQAPAHPLIAHVETPSPMMELLKYGRHAQAAAEIVDMLADQTLGQDVDGKLLRMDPQIPSAHMKQIMQEAGVISVSAMHEDPVPPQGTADEIKQKLGLVGGNIGISQLDAYDLTETDKFWESARVITFEEGGNHGGLCQFAEKNIDAMHYVWAHSHLLRNDTGLRIGALHKDKDGKQIIAAYSACNGPDLVVANPYDDGFAYRYWPGRAEFTDHLKQGEDWRAVFANIYGPTLDLVSHILRSDTIQAYRNNEISQVIQSLNKKGEPWASLSKVYRPAYHLTNLLDGNYPHVGEPVGDYAGTSFTTPAAAGIVGAGMIKHPNLHPYELVAAALASARPVKDLQYLRDPLAYNDNGRGLLYNMNYAGFGQLVPEDFMHHLDVLADIRAQNDGIETKPQRINLRLQDIPLPDEKQRAVKGTGPLVAYKFTVDQSISILKTLIHIDLPKDEDSWPGSFFLIRPDGKRVPLSASSRKGMLDAATHQMLGADSKGDWTLVIPQKMPAKAIQLDFIGYEKGGPIDRYIDKAVQMKKEPSQTPRRRAKAAAQLRPNG